MHGVGAAKYTKAVLNAGLGGCSCRLSCLLLQGPGVGLCCCLFCRFGGEAEPLTRIFIRVAHILLLCVSGRAEHPAVALLSGTGGQMVSSPSLSSAVSGMLLDSTVADTDGHGGWVHQFISGCSTAIAHPNNSSSSWGGAGSLAAEAAAPPPAHQQFGMCDVSQPGWGLVTPAVMQGSVTAPKPLSGGAGRPGLGFRLSWGLGGGSDERLGSAGLDSLRGLDDGEHLNEVLLAAAQLGTPPVPPKGSRFDDMDCFSSSMHKSATAVAAAAVAGELQARKAQQQEQHQHWKQQQKQRSLPHQLLLQLGLPAAVKASSSSNAAAESAVRRMSMDASPLGTYSRASQQQQQQPVSNLLLMLNGQIADSSSSSSDPAAAAAAAAIMGQLEGLIDGLSLLGERSAADVGHELAVAESIHDVCLQHHSRCSNGACGNSDPRRRSFGSRQLQQQQQPRVGGSSGESVTSGMSHSGSNDSLRARLTTASLSRQRRQQEGGSNGGGWQQWRWLLSSVVAGASKLGSTAAAALMSVGAAGINGGSNAQPPAAAAAHRQQRSLSAGAGSSSSAAAAAASASRGAVRRTRSHGANVGQTRGRGGGLWQFPSSSTAAAAATGGQLARAATAGPTDPAVQAQAEAAAAAALAARAAGGVQQGQKKRQGLGSNRRFC